MARLAKVEYDKEHDILHVGYGKKVGDSLQVGKFIIDYSGDEMVGVEVFTASKVVEGLNQNNITKEMLSKFKVARISISRMNELVFFVVSLYTNIRKKESRLLLQVPNVAR